MSYGALELTSQALVAVLALVEVLALARTREGVRRFHVLLCIGLGAWLAEPLAADSALAFRLLNALVACAFFCAGRACFALEPLAHDTRAWSRVRAIACSRAALAIGCAAPFASIAWSGGAREPLAARAFDWTDLPAASVSCLGIVMLGCGLLHELTRARRQPVSLVCGCAVLAYGPLQLFRVWIPALPLVLLLAIVLKVAFLIALLSFWTTANELARTREEQRARIEQSRREAEHGRRIAHELHDLVLNTLWGVQLWTTAARDTLRGAPERAEAALERVEHGIGSCATSVRGILAGLPSTELARIGLRDALSELLRDIRARSRLDTRLVWDVRTPLERRVEECCAAIAFEACHNAERHARARRLEVRCIEAAGALRVEIEDDGIGLDAGSDAGFDADVGGATRASPERARDGDSTRDSARDSAGDSPRGSLHDSARSSAHDSRRDGPNDVAAMRAAKGLATMRERAAALGASWSLGAGARGGTLVRVELASWDRADGAS